MASATRRARHVANTTGDSPDDEAGDGRAQKGIGQNGAQVPEKEALTEAEVSLLHPSDKKKVFFSSNFSNSDVFKWALGLELIPVKQEQKEHSRFVCCLKTKQLVHSSARKPETQQPARLVPIFMSDKTSQQVPLRG